MKDEQLQKIRDSVDDFLRREFSLLSRKIGYRKKEIMRDLIHTTANFPQPGVLFRDIFPLLKNHFEDVIDDLAVKIELDIGDIDYIAGIESRGFILAAALAYRLNKGFIPIRKKGKLPPPVISQKVVLEYRETELEMREGEGNILIVDDVLATGGTLEGAWILAEKSGFVPKQALVLVNMAHLNSKALTFKVKSLLDF